MNRLKKIFLIIKNPKVIRAVAVFLVIAILTAIYIFFQKTTSRVKIDASQIQADIVPVTSQTPAELKKLYVNEGDSIKKGDSIAQVGDEILRSPITGLVIKANTAIGSSISTQSPAVELIDPSQMKIMGTIDENKGLNKLKTGQIISFTIDAYPGKTFWGYLDEISRTAKETQLSFSISSERPTQQFVVFGRFDASAFPQIKNGMSAKMTVYTKTP